MKLAYLGLIAASTAAAPALAADITGPRVEGIIAYDRFDPGTGIRAVDNHLDGVTYGIGLGYDFAVGSNVSLGLDAEVSDSSGDVHVEGTSFIDDISLGRDLYAGGRITTALSGRVNLYGKIGYTNQRVREHLIAGDIEVAGSSNQDGIRAGIGGQLALGGNSYAGVEYRYSNYEAGAERHQVAATLGFRF
ncbi:MAG TPA: outer membrane beta-barrel protein [Allosphingosinicella sp.]